MELYLEPIYRDRNCKGQFNKGHRLRFGGFGKISDLRDKVYV